MSAGNDWRSGIGWSDVAVHAQWITECYGCNVRLQLAPNSARRGWAGGAFVVTASCDRYISDHTVPCGASTFGRQGEYANAAAAALNALLGLQEALEEKLRQAAAQSALLPPGC